MGASGAALRVVVAAEASRRGKESLLSAVVVGDLHTERTHPDGNMVAGG